MKESTKEELKDRFAWDKTESLFDNLIRIIASILVFGFWIYVAFEMFNSYI